MPAPNICADTFPCAGSEYAHATSGVIACLKSTVIIVRLTGGLGNQMFQYAAGRKCALQMGETLKLDLSYLRWVNRKKFTARKYELGIFTLPVQIASDLEVLRFTIPALRFRHLSRALGHLYRRQVLEQSGLNDWGQLEKCGSDCYLIGTWQSERFFAKRKQEILEDFRFPDSYSSTYSTLITEMESCNSVSVHFRRGDYISNPLTAKSHVELKSCYYAAALQIITAKIPDIRCYVFSDDIAWAERNFRVGSGTRYIHDLPRDLPHNDLFLMSKCKHNIIANSSYSWWGAWLNANSEKMVIAPKVWYRKNNLDTKDLIPYDWIRL